MERIRLTKRMASRNMRADSAEPETAIDLGKNRPYHEIDEYHTFEQTVNHELPDMRTEWKADKHDETGHGIPRMAKVYMAAQKATKLAMMLLGENANEASLEAQARAFMRMGDKALTASIERWADCKCDGDSCIHADDETVVEAPAEVPAEEGDAAPAEVPAEEGDVEAPAEVPAEEGDVEVSEAPADDTNVSFDDVDDNADTKEDAAIASCFADDNTVTAPAESSLETACNKKAGLKKLAGQPTLVRVASKNADDLVKLSNCWKWSD